MGEIPSREDENTSPVPENSQPSPEKDSEDVVIEKERVAKLTPEELEKEKELEDLAEKIMERKGLDKTDQIIADYARKFKSDEKSPEWAVKAAMRICAKKYQERHKKAEPNLASENFYERLGVPRCDYAEDIRDAYYKLAEKFHPDKIKDSEDKEEATKNFIAATEAYKTLKDPEKRAAYDAELDRKEVERRVERAVDEVAREDSEDEVIASEWAQNAKEYLKVAGIVGLVGVAAVGYATAMGVEGLAKGAAEVGKFAYKKGKRPVGTLFSAVTTLAFKIVGGLFKFAWKFAKNKGKMSFKDGWEIGEGMFSFEEKKDKK